MSGPPYPPLPTAGSNAIGSLTIGVSPIGTIVPFDYWKTIISQYANSDRLTGIIGAFASAVDQTKNFDAFFDNIWNIDTAVGYGLDVWGRIVGVTRTLNIETTRFFGFEEQEDTTDPFNTSPFYNGTPATTNYELDDQSFRLLILAKAAANITSGSIPALNAILRGLFPGRGRCYVTDGEDMTMTWTFDFELTPPELAIVTQSNVLPRSTGVSATIVQVYS